MPAPFRLAVWLDKEPHPYASVSGVLFNKTLTTLVQVPAGLSGSYTIPSSVTTVGPNALYDCSKLTSITIPSGVTMIGSMSFADTGITAITLPASLKTIDTGAFTGTRITSVTIPNSVTTIGSGAFSCTFLTSITIPSSITSIAPITVNGRQRQFPPA